MLGWRLELNRVPTRDQLQLRQIPLPSTCCPICNCHEETVNHLFLQCSFADSLWKHLLQWCNLPLTKPSNIRDLLSFHKDQFIVPRKRKHVNLIILSYCWIIWKIRNDSIFSNKNPSFRFAAKELKSLSYLWLKNRSQKPCMEWSKWCNFNF
ncbi:RNA-directed DNA polymerase, eukaryota, Reverse transcriptase zinc-binding domain protein [Artemisia annua]|uniref:RNA-directed DNA polymerase, eukaryota, Reverse transcriptase zinc-binding domain protein n=1 Tax=Artemisia annua TaxID=35608 RepID=A0A2U1PH39_ARTAN|nr:RNA-directed DNA polymerase, eukaryota, Reverse transcriptase zinc-binding domain protein [Artemisia annua]